MQPDLKHIRALAAIKEHGSFRQAAQSLSISAPGLTKIVQALERHLGVDLVDRTPRPASLTKYGQAVCDQGADAIASIELGLRQVEVMKGLEQAELVISTNAFFSVAIAPRQWPNSFRSTRERTFRSALNRHAMPPYTLTSATPIFLSGPKAS